MSAPHIAWAFGQRGLTPGERLVLLALADRANGERACCPSYERIADDCEISRAAVARAIRVLSREDDTEKGGPKLAKALIEKITGPERLEYLARMNCSARSRANVYRILRPLEDCERKVRKLFDWDAPVETVPDPATVSTLDASPETDGPVTVSTLDGHTDASALEQSQPETPNSLTVRRESPIESFKEEKSVATQRQRRVPTLPGLPVVVSDSRVRDDLNPKTVADQFWSEGRRIVRKLTGESHRDAGVTLGSFRKLCGNLSLLLDILAAAEREDTPGHGLYGYVQNGIKTRLTPKPTFVTAIGRIAEAQGMHTPEKRQEFRDELTRDYSGFAQEASDHVR